MPKLGVNVDHIASLRELRHGTEPSVVFAALICEAAGADSIVVHLREDRRHIKEEDLRLLRKALKGKLNLEMSVAKDIVEIACKIKPDQATLVPEKRQELTTEGGLDVVKNFKKIKQVSSCLERCGITVSLFIDPVKSQIDASSKVGVKMVELHTGRYADAKGDKGRDKYFKELKRAVNYGLDKGLIVNAGHGLNYYNAARVAGIKGLKN